jgi:hypothetical protein
VGARRGIDLSGSSRPERITISLPGLKARSPFRQEPEVPC